MSESQHGEKSQVEDVEAAGEGHDTAPYAGADPGVILEQLPQMLSPRQRLALAEIGKGVSIAKAAQTVGVNRSTLHRWIKADPTFRAAYNAWQQEILESARARLVRCADAAADRIATMVEYDHKLAFQVVKELGVFRRTSKQTDPQLVERQIQLQRDEAEFRLDRRQLKYLMTKAGMPEMEDGKNEVSNGQTNTFDGSNETDSAETEDVQQVPPQ
ncbi:MAG TPA: helix-turn-helix domain-containing protein [Tepidisphaeraceae bacterium]|nr:helix-turn-helix domain-containing protein [Tepidisphaeraceae bacterium]